MMNELVMSVAGICHSIGPREGLKVRTEAQGGSSNDVSEQQLILGVLG